MSRKHQPPEIGGGGLDDLEPLPVIVGKRSWWPKFRYRYVLIVAIAVGFLAGWCMAWWAH